MLRTSVFYPEIMDSGSLCIPGSMKNFLHGLNNITRKVAARLGVRECVLHELLLPYPVLNERKDDVVAHVKVTVMILPSGNTSQITGLPPSTYVDLVKSGVVPTLPAPAAAATTTEADVPPPAVAATTATAPLPPVPAYPPVEGLASKLSASLPVALTLLAQKQAQVNSSNNSNNSSNIVPENIVKLLESTSLESKKKAKKSAAANKKAGAATATTTEEKK
jgi:hypothetical protein